MKKDKIEFYKPNDIPELTILDAHISSFRYKTHAHDDYAIGMTLDGTQCFKCNQTDYKVNKGGIIQINPEEPHDGFAEDENGYTYKMIYIPRNFVNDLATDTGTPFRFNETVTYDPIMRSAFMTLARNLETSPSDGDEKSSVLNEFVLNFIERNEPSNVNVCSSAEFDIVDRSINFMYQNIDGKLELDDICSAMCISKFHFIRIFKKVTYRTPYQFILDIKLDKARKELEAGSDPKSVADKFGFYDLSHLIRRYKSAYGITPYMYQKQFL